ncbi:hypothetical protein QJS10_CPA05g02092 [Acorus calamus]|uniref:Fe-S metabolism associated domain-containing protein n=1 Tax=Acorus calamus TaxID=4465 RepID=A0AAV9ESN8_ACOCL|nr:hypothetical protein QJS10_CPA05g02092 [Acorus calamus]
MAASITSISYTASLRSFPSKTHLRPPNPTLKNLSFLHKIPSSSISIQTQFTPNPPSSSLQQIPDSDTQSAPDDESILSSLPPTLRDIVRLFRTVSDPRAKYEQLLHYARTLPPMDPSLKTDRDKVRGCVSQVWVHARAISDAEVAASSESVRVRFEADSDAVITKGLASLLVQGLSGCSASEVVRVRPEFLGLLGLQQSLTPSRNNGFLNMLSTMQRKALEIELGGGGGGEASVVNDRLGIGSEKVEKDEILSGGDANSGGGEGRLGERGRRIGEVLMRELKPVELRIEDESHKHAGHAGVGGRAGEGGETHFNVRVVSEAFEGKRLLKRHRMVYDLLKDELESGLHALSIDAKTPEEIGGN